MEEEDDDDEQKKKKKEEVRQSFGKVLVWITSCGKIISPLLFRETSKKPSYSQDKHNLDTPQSWAL